MNTIKRIAKYGIDTISYLSNIIDSLISIKYSPNQKYNHSYFLNCLSTVKIGISSVIPSLSQ